MKFKRQQAGAILAFVMLGLVVVCMMVAYVSNILKLVGADEFLVEEALRAVGVILVPLGIIMGGLVA